MWLGRRIAGHARCARSREPEGSSLSSFPLSLCVFFYYLFSSSSSFLSGGGGGGVFSGAGLVAHRFSWDSNGPILFLQPNTNGIAAHIPCWARAGFSPTYSPYVFGLERDRRRGEEKIGEEEFKYLIKICHLHVGLIYFYFFFFLTSMPRQPNQPSILLWDLI